MKYHSATKYILLAVLLLIAPVVSAVTAPDVLNKVLRTVESAPSITLNLRLASGQTSGKGTLIVAKECFIFSGEDIKVCYDGKTQWTHQISEREVTLTNPTANELAEVNPLSFLKNYQANYKVNILSSAGGKYKIQLLGKRRSLYVRSAVVTVSATTWLPTRIDAELSNGGKLTVDVDSAVKGKAIPAAKFKFSTSANPGVEVIDLR